MVVVVVVVVLAVLGSPGKRAVKRVFVCLKVQRFRSTEGKDEVQ